MKTHFVAHVHPSEIHGVLWSCIEEGVSEFQVSDDRGGTGLWLVAVPKNLITLKRFRQVVGKGIHIEEVWL